MTKKQSSTGAGPGQVSSPEPESEGRPVPVDPEIQECIRRLVVERDEARADVRQLREANDSRQRSIELVGCALAELLPDFRASGTGEEHSAAVACAIRSEVGRLRARIAELEAEGSRWAEMVRGLAREVERLKAARDALEDDPAPSGRSPTKTIGGK